VGRIDAQTATGYWWRGIWRSGGPVAQLDGAGGVEWGAWSLTAGFWTNLELRRAGPGRRTDLGPGSRGWTEQNSWIQLAARLDRLTLSGGAIRSRYRRPDLAVTDVYGSARLQDGRWTYEMAAWQAVAGGSGAYLEPALTFTHAANPFAGPALSLATTARVGIQVGHRGAGSSGPMPGADGTGLTHVSLAPAVVTRVPLAGPLAATASFSLDLQYRRDRATRIDRNGGLGSRLRLWLPLQIGLTFPYRRPE
jgi:hypothetical protein